MQHTRHHSQFYPIHLLEAATCSASVLQVKRGDNPTSPCLSCLCSASSLTSAESPPRPTVSGPNGVHPCVFSLWQVVSRHSEDNVCSPPVCCTAEAPLEHSYSRCLRVHRAGTGTGGRCPRRVPTPASWAQMDEHVRGVRVGAPDLLL